MRSDRTSRRMSGAAWVAVTLAVLFAVQAWTPAVDAQARSGVAPPPGDCWGGVLSGDPLHCYVFEEAQKAGLMEVDSMYLAPGLAPLYVYLEQSEMPSTEVFAFLRSKTYEYMAQPGEGPGSYGAWECGSLTGRDWRLCILRVLDYPSWSGVTNMVDFTLPKSVDYYGIALRLGGREARRSVGGWASWKQLWPVPAGGASASGSTGFDVSDVDLRNIPEIDCDKGEFHSGQKTSSCWAWVALGGAEPGFAGIHAHDYGDTIYVHTTTPIPEDPAGLEALKLLLAPAFEMVGLHWSRTGKGESYKVEFIPVKYDFGQLWRWRVILDRFALSAGNNVGIDGVWVDTNAEFDDGRNRRLYTWLNGVQPSGSDGATWNWDRVRNILTVRSLDPEATIAAFPTLLPALGIPTDAVGLVVRSDRRPWGPAIPLPGNAQPAQTPTPAPAVMRAPPPELDCADDSGAPLLSFCDAW